MNKENKNGKGAAGLRRSALVERIRLREEWSALKETGEPAAPPRKRPQHVLGKKHTNIQSTGRVGAGKQWDGSDALRGVVALVEAGGGARTLALRAALAALGASVVPRWSPLVTHLVWAEGGCRAVRARARALAARLVSPLWVEACAAAARRLPERAFPAAARPSDLPSPRTLQSLLRRAEEEGAPLSQLFPTNVRRQGSATSGDSSDTNSVHAKPTLPVQTRPTVHPCPPCVPAPSVSRVSNPLPRVSKPPALPTLVEGSVMETPQDMNLAEPERGVNTNRRGGGGPRACQPSETRAPVRSRRKLFTQREQASGSDEPSSEEESRPGGKAAGPGGGRALARAERLARRLARTPNARGTHDRHAPRLVLTGMTRTERHLVCEAVRALGGRLQNNVTKKTSHVLLGSCGGDGCTQNDADISTYSALSTMSKPDRNKNNHNITGISTLSKPNSILATTETHNNMENEDVTVVEKTPYSGITGTAGTIPASGMSKLRTLKALEGAARGCRVLRAQWALDSATAKRWTHHHGYEVPHLYKVSQKARAERQALGRVRTDYAYDVFCGMRVRLGTDVEQRDACIRLLSLCGAIIIDAEGNLNQTHVHVRHGRAFQDGGCAQNGGEFDLTVGTSAGEVSSKWVFDSVAAGRMRTTRRYIHHQRASLALAAI